MSRWGKTLSLMLLVFVALAYACVICQAGFAKQKHYYTRKFVKPKTEEASDYQNRYYPNGYNPYPYYYQPVTSYSYMTSDGYYVQSYSGNRYRNQNQNRYRNRSSSSRQNPYFNRNRSNPYFRR